MKAERHDVSQTYVGPLYVNKWPACNSRHAQQPQQQQQQRPQQEREDEDEAEREEVLHDSNSWVMAWPLF